MTCISHPFQLSSTRLPRNNHVHILKTLSMSIQNPYTVLGIDPGFALCGYGVIQVTGNQLRCLDYGAISTQAGTPLEDRLSSIYQELQTICEKHKPNLVGIEELFFAKNTKTALTVGHARGVILLALRHANIPMFHYTPLQVKQAVTTYGRAEKQQVQEMVRILLGMPNIPQPDDAADALAVAICCANTENLANYSLNLAKNT